MGDSLLLLAAAALAFAVTALLGKLIIPFLHKLKFGQTIREAGPSWHKNKQGTPTMGGIMFIIGICVAMTAVLPAFYSTSGETGLMLVKTLGGLLMAVAFGAIGFMDDFISIKRKRNLGLNEKQKLVLQFLTAGAYLGSVAASGGGTSVFIPFIGMFNLGWSYYILAALLIVFIVNAVNFTDGVDGLNGMVTFVAALTLSICAGLMNTKSLSLMGIAAAGACAGFLIWNFHPAKVFMGDTGSLFLGGIVCALAFGMDSPLLLLPAGIVYICEIVSVILQVTYFKATHGKRLFKMSPIHHHFEMCGWSEVKICVTFSAVSVLGGAVAVALTYFGR